MDTDLPAEDRERSPRTGWTRAHWLALADELLEGVRPYGSSRGALINPPGSHVSSSGDRSDGLEGFARTFLLAAYRLAADGGHAPGDLAARYTDGLLAGTDPGSDEAWPSIGNYGQPIIEAGFVALALHETRPWIWEALDDRDRERVVAWLSGVHGKQTGLNNWRLSPVVVNAFLKSVGAPHHQDEIDGNLDLVDSWYRRDGWYTDGPGQSYDHYNGWKLHFDTAMWCRIDGDRNDADRAAVYRDRLSRFVDQYQLLFGGNGAPLYHGRSLTYRFATAAPLWAGALLGATPLEPGLTRRIASGVLRHFVDRGAIRDGLLTLGWYDEFLPMVQRYSGHGSPYWASKAFAGLLLPPDDPVWTATEEPMPVERGDYSVALPGPGFLVRGTGADGIVQVSSHRSDHFPLWGSLPPRSLGRRVAGRVARALGGSPPQRPTVDDPHYRKLSYSTHTAPECGGDDADVDSQVTLLAPDGTRSRRLRLGHLFAADRVAASVFHPSEPRWTDRIETITIARGAAEVRIHHVSAPDGGTLRDGGFAVAGDEPPTVEVGDRWALVRRADGLTSFVAGLLGFDRAAVQRSEGSNPFGPHSAAPYLTGSEDLAPEGICVSLVLLTAEALDPDGTVGTVAELEVEARQVSLAFSDGERWLAQMVSADPVNRDLGGTRLEGPVRVARVSPDGSSYVLVG